ncbi:hypothetical protein [Micromonospora sp. NPDC047730]
MPEPPTHPEDLGRFFVAHANAGDIDGLVALYERQRSRTIRAPRAHETHG